jgi:hypothetical protein
LLLFERFYPSKAKQIADKIISDELNGVSYDEEDAKNWSLNISDKIREAVHENLGKSRFKIVVQTTIGQLKDQGIRIASRCLWDPNTDNYASCKYSNVSCSRISFSYYDFVSFCFFFFFIAGLLILFCFDFCTLYRLKNRSFLCFLLFNCM